MPHYATSFSINRLRIPARLGVTEAERAAPQPVEISLRLYFAQPPACTGDDHAAFVDYHALSTQLSAMVVEREFRLIEYMAQQLFDHARAYLERHRAVEVKLWLKLTKCAPAVEYLQDGASFTLSDLPAGATVAPTE